MDVAASEFWVDSIKKYDLDFKSGDKSEMKDVDRYKTPIDLLIKPTSSTKKC